MHNFCHLQYVSKWVKLKKLEIERFKNWNRDRKKQRNKAEDNVTNTFNHIFVLYPEHTSTDLLSYTYYRVPNFDFMAPLADVTIVAEYNHNCTTTAMALCRYV